MIMKIGCVNHEYLAECLATFAKEVNGEEVTLQIAEFGEDIEIVVENTEGSVQYILDNNNHFQVTEIDEDNILNEIVDVLEKSDLYLPNIASSLKIPSEIIETLDPLFTEIEDYTNKIDVDHLIDTNFVPLDLNLDDLGSANSSDILLPLNDLLTPNDVLTPNVLKTEAVVVLENVAIPTSFEVEEISSCFEDSIEEGEIVSIHDIHVNVEDVYRNDIDTREDGEVLYFHDNKENVQDIIYISETETGSNNAVTNKLPLRSVRKRIWTCETCQFVALTKRLLTTHEREHAPQKSVRNTKSSSKKSVHIAKNASSEKSIFNTVITLRKKSVRNTVNASSKKSIRNTVNASSIKSIRTTVNALSKKSVHITMMGSSGKSIRNIKNASSKTMKSLAKYKMKTCPLCGKIFPDIYDYELHLIYHKNRKYID